MSVVFSKFPIELFSTGRGKMAMMTKETVTSVDGNEKNES